MSEELKRDRVKLNLWKERSTTEGLVLEYLQSKHPLGLSGSVGVMSTLLAHWLPITLKENCSTKDEYQKAAAYSVRQLLAQVDWIISECDLPPLLLGQSEHTNVLPASKPQPVSGKPLKDVSDRSVVEASPVISGESLENDEDYSWLDEPDDSGIDLSDMVVDAGFRS